MAEILPREALLAAVWGYSEQIRTRTLDVHVRRLRMKLGTSADPIETVRGAGEYFISNREGAGTKTQVDWTPSPAVAKQGADGKQQNVLGVQVSVKSQLAIVVASIIPFLILIVKVIIDGGVAGNSGTPFNPGKVAEGSPGELSSAR